MLVKHVAARAKRQVAAVDPEPDDRGRVSRERRAQTSSEPERRGGDAAEPGQRAAAPREGLSAVEGGHWAHLTSGDVKIT